MSMLYQDCSTASLGILGDMHTCTTLFLQDWDLISTTQPHSYMGAETHHVRTEQIYTHLLLLPSAEDTFEPDWIYESCRLAALIYCRSILHGATFADSANRMHARCPNSGSQTLSMLSALHEVLQRTDTHNSWGENLRGCFLWVSLIGAMASWSTTWIEPGLENHAMPTHLAWMRKCFALYAVRAVVSVPFEHAEATMRALQTMFRVRQCISTNIDLQSLVHQ